MSVILRTPLSRAADYANRGRAEQTMTRSLAVFSCPLEWVSMTVFNYEADYSFAIVILRMSFGSILDILALKVVAWWRSVAEQWLCWCFVSSEAKMISDWWIIDMSDWLLIVDLSLDSLTLYTIDLCLLPLHLAHPGDVPRNDSSGKTEAIQRWFMMSYSCSNRN